MRVQCQPVVAVLPKAGLGKDLSCPQFEIDPGYQRPLPCARTSLYFDISAASRCFHKLSTHRSGDKPGTQSRCIVCTKPISVFLSACALIHEGNDIRLR